jgi:hypothetical protein
MDELLLENVRCRSVGFWPAEGAPRYGLFMVEEDGRKLTIFVEPKLVDGLIHGRRRQRRQIQRDLGKRLTRGGVRARLGWPDDWAADWEPDPAEGAA